MKWRFWKRKSATVLKIVPKIEKPKMTVEEAKDKIKKHACACCFKTEDEVLLCLFWYERGKNSGNGRPYICNECQFELIEMLKKHKAKSKMKVVK
jgi:hypothetical protein